jgi:excisionase family DNA binding protein
VGHSDNLDAVLQWLVRLDERLARMEAGQALLLKQHTHRDWYTTKQLAQLLGRKEYTVREWCRLGRVAAKKLPAGRGGEGEWRIPHAELERYQQEGLLPLSQEALLR